MQLPLLLNPLQRSLQQAAATRDAGSHSRSTLKELRTILHVGADLLQHFSVHIKHRSNSAAVLSAAKTQCRVHSRTLTFLQRSFPLLFPPATASPLSRLNLKRQEIRLSLSLPNMTKIIFLNLKVSAAALKELKSLLQTALLFQLGQSDSAALQKLLQRCHSATGSVSALIRNFPKIHSSTPSMAHL